MTVNIYGMGNVTASKDVLNSLACVLLDAEDKAKEEGYETVANVRFKQFLSIHEALDKVGYYK